ncbi:MAG: D-alanyl-D-alanine carboxypeptidase [Gammaproteobacteria bacterium]|nr:D-alanyl-D-alanine carboxypeptidase [Gammaproteobacteria bacterium]NNJ72113.1 D-alanyl-D-alanine carboxypeptidase [Enterobacterales bacterium]
MTRTVTKSLLIALSIFISSNILAIVPKQPEMPARAYILIDFDTGEVLAEKNADELIAPSSLTKMMTSYVLSDEVVKGNVSYDDMVTISENAWAKKFPGSSVMFIEVGEQVSVRDLKKGIVIASGNDACVAIAEHLAGTESGFAELMNFHAERLGMSSTFFVNSHGLSAPQHLSTARDMAILSQALIRDFPDDYTVNSVKEFTFNGIKQYNRNSLLWDRSLNVDGIKTGHTDAGGYALVASATKDSMRLISVVMGSKSTESRKRENKQLLNYGFRFFETFEPIQPGKSLHEERIWYGAKPQVKLGLGESVLLTIPRGDKTKLKASYEFGETLEAPLNKGQQVGTVIFELDGNRIKEAPLVALETVEEGGLWSKFTDYVSQSVDGLMN